MKVNDINIDMLLYTEPVKNKPYDDEEEGGFFKKLISRKEDSRKTCIILFICDHGENIWHYITKII